MTRSSRLGTRQYSIEPKTRKYVKGYGFLLFARKYKKQFVKQELVEKIIISPEKRAEILSKLRQLL